MIKTIITNESKILRNQTKDIRDFKSAFLKKVIRDLRVTLKKTPQGIGLAAPQIGISLKIFVIDRLLAKNLKIPDIFINPQILNSSFRKEKLEEGCLSVSKIYGLVKRYKSVKLKAYDENGHLFIIKASGLISQIIQHEIDHLNGVLFTDKAVKCFDITKI